MTSAPQTIAQLSHALTIRVGIGTSGVVGAVNEFNPRQQRQVTLLYELGVVTGPFAQLSGDPFEAVPGNVTGNTVEVKRWDLYTSQLETAFGTVDVSMLSSQLSSFTMRGAWMTPGNINNYADVYSGNWWSEMSRQLSATNDRTVNAGGQITYTSRRRVPLAA